MIVKDFLKVITKRTIIYFELLGQNRDRLLYNPRGRDLPQEWENREISLISPSTLPTVILDIYVK